MIRPWIDTAAKWLHRVLTQPRSELDRWQKAARYCYDLGRHGAKQLHHDRAPQMAAALAFRALFGLLPALVVITVAVRSLMEIDDFLKLADTLMADANLDQFKVLLPDATADGGQATSTTLAAWLHELVGQAASVNLAAVGWVGLALVIYAAIGLMVTIENAFNIVYRAPEGRSWTRRVPLYWFVLTISPVAAGLTVYLNGRFEGWILSVDTWNWALVTGRLLWNLLVGWSLMLAAYMLVPNTRVTFSAAGAGAFVSVVLLEIGKRTLGVYFAKAFSISQLYGSLGLIPLFMFWVYLMWLAVLFGLEVSAILQTFRGRRLEELDRQRQHAGFVDPACVLAVMELIAERFNTGSRATAEQLAEELHLPRLTVVRMLERLVEANLLHVLDRDDWTVCLARPPEQTSAEELIELGFQLADVGTDGRQSRMLKRLREAQKQLAAETTLAGLVGNVAPSGQS